MYLILRHIEKGRYRAAVSPVHMKEVAAIQEIEERLEIEELRRNLDTAGPNNDPSEAQMRAQALCVAGFGIADAAHIAFAEQMADFFITCDDKLLKRGNSSDLNVVTCSPIEFVTQEELA